MKPIPTIVLVLCIAAPTSAFAQVHHHFGAGIHDSNGNHEPDAGEALAFAQASEIGRTFHLLPRPVGQHPIQRCGGYFMLDERPRTLHAEDAFSFTALSSGIVEVESANHAHNGANIWLEIVTVEGPPGAHFGFWDENRSLYFHTPSVSFATGQPTGNYAFVLSEGGDDPAEDPQGHIHGRSWTVDRAGEYRVGIRLVDRSTSGPGGGPWHAPSEIYYLRFLAGPSFQPTSVASTPEGFRVTWPSKMGIYAGDPQQTGITFHIQRSTSLDPEDWEPVGSVVGTTGTTATFTDAAPPPGGGFYRITHDWSVH